MTSKQQAFTLVELSIVLVILGLLVGGVLSGQSLIHAAQLRSVSTDYEQYITATKTFRDKYFANPGDMANATQFWGRLNSNANCPTNSAAAVNAATGACDGNGDGNVSGIESQQYWSQLVRAGLITGTFTGLGVSTDNDIVPGVNAPLARIGTGLGWGISSNDWSNYLSFPVVGGFGTNYVLGSHAPGDQPLFPGMLVEDAWNIDKKLDDGLPASGSVVTVYGNAPTQSCTTATNTADMTALYRLNNTVNSCVLIFTHVW